MSIYRVGTLTENPIEGSSPGDIVVTSDPSGRVFIGESNKPATLVVHGEGVIFNGSIDFDSGNLNSKLNFGGTANLGSLQVGTSEPEKFNDDITIHALSSNNCTIAIANDIDDPLIKDAGIYISSIIDNDTGKHSSRLYMRDGRDEKNGLSIVNNATGRGIADNGSGVIRPSEYPSTINKTMCWNIDSFSIDTSPDGNYVVAYIDISNNLIVTRGFNTLVGQSIIISNPINQCEGFSIIMLEDTGFVISWENNGNVWIKYYNADNITPTNPYFVDGFSGIPKLTLLPNNRFSLTADNGNTRIYELPVSTAFIQDSPINVDIKTYCIHATELSHAYYSNVRSFTNGIVNYSIFTRFITTSINPLAILSLINEIDNEELNLYIENNTIKITNGNDTLIGTTTITTNDSHNLSVSISGLQTNVYIDGVLDISGSLTQIPSADRIDRINIGYVTINSGITQWNGYLDDFLFINSIVTESQIKELHNNGYSLLYPNKTPLTNGQVIDLGTLHYINGGYNANTGEIPYAISLLSDQDFDFTPSSAYLKGKSKVVVCWSEMQNDGKTRVMYRVSDVDVSGSNSNLILGTINYASDGGAFEELHPHVAGLHNGGFAIAWEIAGYEGEARRILLRMFNEHGTQITNEITIGTTPESDQRNPYIVSLYYTGGIVILWDSIRCGYTTRTIHYQRVDMFGTVLDELEMPVTDDIYNQIRPSGLELPDGKFAVSYISNPDGEWRIDGRRFMVNTGLPFDPGHATISDTTSSVDPNIRPQMIMMTMTELHDETPTRIFRGHYCILWKGYNLGEKNTLYMRVNNHIGARIDDDIAINMQTEMFHFVHNLNATSGKDGNICVSWDMRLGTGDTEYVYIGVYDISGANVITPYRVMGGSGNDRTIRPSVIHIGGDRDVYSLYGVVYEKDLKSVEMTLVNIENSAIVGTLFRFNDLNIVSSLELDGTSKFVKTYDGVLPVGDSSISVCAWIKSLNLYGTEWRTIVYVGGVTKRRISLEVKENKARVNFGESSVGDIVYIIELPYNVHNDVWHHICVACDVMNQRARLYLDGHVVWDIGVAYSQQELMWSLKQVQMGSKPSSDEVYSSVDASSSFIGKLSNVTLHTKALTEGDIMYIYNGGNPSYLEIASVLEEHPLELWAWWTLAEFDDNTSFRDDSNNDHNARLYRFEYSLREIVPSRWNIDNADAILFGNLRGVSSGWFSVGMNHDSRMCVIWVDGVVNSVKGVIADVSGNIMGDFEIGGRVGEIKDIDVTSFRENLGEEIGVFPRGFTLVWSEERVNMEGVIYYEIWTTMVGLDGVFLDGFDARRVDTMDVNSRQGGTQRLGIGVCDLKKSGFFMTWGSMARAFDVKGVPITYEVDMCELTGAIHNVTIPPVGCIPLASPCVTSNGVIIGWLTIDALSGDFYVQVTSFALNAYSQCNIIESGQVAFMRKDGNIDRGISTMSIDKPSGDINIHVKCPESTLHIGGGVEFLSGKRVRGLPKEPTGFRVFYPSNTDINIFIGETNRISSYLSVIQDAERPGPDPREWRIRDPLNMSEFNVEASFQNVNTGQYIGVDMSGNLVTLPLPWAITDDESFVDRVTWRVHMIGVDVICFQNSWSLGYVSYNNELMMVNGFTNMTSIQLVVN